MLHFQQPAVPGETTVTHFFTLNCSLFTGNTQACQLLTIVVPSFAMLADLSSSKSVQRIDTLRVCRYFVRLKSVFKSTFILVDIFVIIADFVIRPWKQGPPCIAVPAH